MGQVTSTDQNDELSQSDDGKSGESTAEVNKTNPHKPQVREKTDSNQRNLKKKFTRLGTLRRKLARTLRTAKSSDYRKQITDLLQTWTLQEIRSLIKQYDGLEALKTLTKLSDLARPKPPNIQQDLQRIYDKNICSDLTIVYQMETFNVHKAILCSRCNFFDEYVKNIPLNDEGKLQLDIQGLDLSVSMFTSLLRYLYSGQIKDSNLTEILSQLGKKYGLLNSVQYDMKHMLARNSQFDLRLIFENHSNIGTHTYIDQGETTVDNSLEVSCHTAVLCARSNFFRSLLTEKIKSHRLTNSSEPLKLILNEKIIPRSYIKVILNCFYTDKLDLTSIIKWKVADDGSGEADRLLTTSEHAMELYEIGQFLEFPMLMQGCEDIIVENFNVSSLLGVLEWSSQPFGSLFVHRQAIQFFREEFYPLCKTSIFLANIPKKFMLEVIKSDFLQANEEFLLATIIKWGEWLVAKSNEKPGTSTGNSLPRRSPKRRDINNKVLLDMISDLLPYVRLKHILPSNSSVLNTAYQRSLLQRPFPFDVVAADKNIPNMVFWLNECRHKDYTRPRLFMPYVCEVKLVLHERLTENEHSCTASQHTQQRLPDMLPLHQTSIEEYSQHNDERPDHSSVSILEVMKLDPAAIKDMVLREKELKSLPVALKALSLVPDTAEIGTAIHLRVVREFGLPDEMAVELFQQSPDLIEDSAGSSSDSSKQSTLSKVGRLLKDEVVPRVTRSSSDCYDEITRTSQDDVLSQTNILLRKGVSYNNVRSIEDSPLDLKLTETNNDLQLPNVLMDT